MSNDSKFEVSKRKSRDLLGNGSRVRFSSELL